MITPEQFMAQPADPDEETSDPLTSIATSLERLVGLVEAHAAEEREEDGQRALVDELDRELQTAHAETDSLHALIEKVLETCKPSVSKLANQIREVLEPPAVEEHAPTSGDEASQGALTPASDEPPANDAPIEEWVAFAQARGFEVDPGRTNRAQIRTLLGIPQPVSAG